MLLRCRDEIWVLREDRPSLVKVDWTDLIIIVLVVYAGFRGRRVGALRQIAHLIGLGAGFILGTLIAPPLSSAITHARWRPALALIIVIVASMLGAHLGRLLGGVVAKSLHVVRLGILDSIGGVVVGVLGVLVASWLVAGLLVSTTWGSLASQIQGSRILSALDKVMPPVPSFEAQVQSLLRGVDFPNVFASVIAPSLPPSVAPRLLGPSVSSLGTPSDVLKVLASGGCARIQEGTAFFVRPHEVVTNAHVVAGESSFSVGGVSAQVALYDPNNDIAVLRVDAISGVPLRFRIQAVPRDTRAYVVGFPLDASRTGSPGYIEGIVAAQSRDIYNQNLTTRNFEVVEVNIQPGNSGSPVLVGPFVAGVVESKILSETSTAYAIPASVVERDVARTPALGSVSTEGCVP